ncbi:MAG: hypothetical protein C4523_14195 [Myxococcales bacterium]|nr:MAG: hypothetical protein C4523_14195 [Myxococcales bacterium]
MNQGCPNSHWVAADFEDILEILDCRRVPVNAEEREKRPGKVPYYGATGQVGWIDDYLFDEELILLGEDGAPFLQSDKSKAYLIRGKSWVNNHAHVLRAFCGTPNLFWKYQLDQVDYHPFVSGTTRLKLPQAPMRKIPLLVPPLPEQHRIVEAIESYLTRLDAVTAALERVRANLKLYRASVLKAAVEGRLAPTEAELTKAEGRDYEPASVLLQRILMERRRRWEQSGKKGKYKEPAAPDTSNLPELPEGWCWATVEQLLDEPLSNGRSVPTSADGFPVLRLTALKNGEIDLGEHKNGAWSIADAEPFLVKRGDFFVSRGNGSIRFVGRGGLVKSEPFPVAYPDTLIKVRISPTVLLPELLTRLWNSQIVRSHIEKKAKTTAGIYKVNQGDLELTILPLPPFQEQERILCELERLDSLATMATAQVSNNFKRATRLRQAILKWAFEGRLADQDPNDEPAEKLLERMREERKGSALEKESRRKKGRPRRAT